MCGITASITQDDTSLISVIAALNKLQNRGYDSAGICLIKNNVLITQKFISKPGQNAMEFMNAHPIRDMKCNLSVGHTRWATHGARTLENTHPHTDDEGRFAMVHNGIIENYLELRQALIKDGYSFYGQTDTEIVVKYLSYLAKNNRDYSELSTIIKGSWAILFVDIMTPDKIYFMKNSSPLIFGYNSTKSKMMFVSELIGFDSDIETYHVLRDKDYGYVSLDEFQSTTPYQSIEVGRAIAEDLMYPYKHWTLKEINDQPKSISNLIFSRVSADHHIYFPELDAIKDELSKVQHLIFLACGTSYHAAQIGAKFFKEFRSEATVEVIDGADFDESDIPPKKKSLLVLLSQSGETRDLYGALVLGTKHKLLTIGIINVENSLIAREVDVCLYLKAGREYAVASTKSFTNQVLMMLLLAIWMNPSPNLNVYLDAIDTLPTEFERMIRLSEEHIPPIMEFFEKQNDCFILGRQISEWVAKEGSLKIKEISYIHSEGYSTASLKHGPFALIVNHIPIILLAHNDKFYPKVENAIAEVKSRESKVILITNKIPATTDIDHVIYFETNSILFPLLCIVPLQLLAYHLSLQRGNHPDYPRNLAKVVTVE